MSPTGVAILQRAIGNRAVGQLIGHFGTDRRRGQALPGATHASVVSQVVGAVSIQRNGSNSESDESEMEEDEDVSDGVEAGDDADRMLVEETSPQPGADRQPASGTVTVTSLGGLKLRFSGIRSVLDTSTIGGAGTADKKRKRASSEDSEGGDTEETTSAAKKQRVGTAKRRRFSSTLAVKSGQTIVPAERIHADLSSDLGKGLTKASENQVAASLGFIVSDQFGNRRSVSHRIPGDFKSGATSSTSGRSVGAHLQWLYTWLTQHNLASKDMVERAKRDTKYRNATFLGTFGHSEQALVHDLLHNVTTYLDELMHQLVKGDWVTVVLLDVASVPNSICDNCHRSIEALLSDPGWLDTINGALGGEGFTSTHRPVRVVRASSPVVFTGARGQYPKARERGAVDELTDIDALGADVVFLEQMHNYADDRSNDATVATHLARALRGAAPASGKPGGGTIVQLPRQLTGSKSALRVGQVVELDGQRWRVAYFDLQHEPPFALLDPVVKESESAETHEARNYPSFNVEGWQHRPQDLPDWILEKGVADGDTILINDVQYRVREVPGRAVEPTVANPKGLWMIVVPRLRGG